MPVTTQEMPKPTQEMPKSATQEMTKTTTLVKQPKTTEEIGSHIFDFFDKEKKGFLNEKEIKALLDQTFKNHKVSEQYYTETLKLMDLNNDGTLSKKKYISFLKKFMDKSLYASN